MESILASIRVPRLGDGRNNQSVVDAKMTRLALPEHNSIYLNVGGVAVQD